MAIRTSFSSLPNDMCRCHTTTCPRPFSANAKRPARFRVEYRLPCTLLGLFYLGASLVKARAAILVRFIVLACARLEPLVCVAHPTGRQKRQATAVLAKCHLHARPISYIRLGWVHIVSKHAFLAEMLRQTVWSCALTTICHLRLCWSRPFYSTS